MLFLLATHQQAERRILVEVMEIRHQCEVSYPAALHHPCDGIPDTLWVTFHAKEVKGDVQAIGGIWYQLQIANLGDVEVAQDTTKLKKKRRTFHLVQMLNTSLY